MSEATNQSQASQKAPVRVFLAATVLIFFFSLSAADSVGLVPYYVDGSHPDRVSLHDLPELGEEVQEQEHTPVETAQPERIIINDISLDLPVLNPETRDIEALDVVLQDGPARYVDSAALGEKGNVLIFAHTSHLPVVHNQMYRAFNRLPELEAGAAIVLQGGGKEYLYSVTTVRRADAEDEIIDLSPSLGEVLTLVTCDTLTSKSSRWIVEAQLIGSYDI